MIEEAKQKLDLLKIEMDKRNKEVARLEGNLESLIKDLETKCNIKTEDEAKNLLLELEKEKEKQILKLKELMLELDKIEVLD